MHPLVSSTWGEEERWAAIEVIQSGNYTMGAKVSAFEKRFAEYVGTKYAVMVNSGSSANLLMVAAYTLRYGPGVVFCPAVGWSTSFSPFQQYGWKVIFLDINRETLNFEPVHLWKAVEKYDDPVILAVNLLGNPNDFYAFPRKAHVLEDNCESLGAEYQGRKTGSIGLMGTHSFFFAHHICTMEGGAITTNDELFYETLLCLRSHGWTRHLPPQNAHKVTPSPFEFIYPGYNVRPGEINGAVGLKQLDKLDKLIEVRRDNAARFPLKTQREIGKSSWYSFAVFGEDVERVKKTCETRPIVTGNFVRSPSLKHYDYEVFETLDNANYIHDHGCYIGNHGTHIDWSFL